ncbi:hypothetical protein [Pectobacterium phage PcaP1EGY]
MSQKFEVGMFVQRALHDNYWKDVCPKARLNDVFVIIGFVGTGSIKLEGLNGAHSSDNFVRVGIFKRGDMVRRMVINSYWESQCSVSNVMPYSAFMVDGYSNDGTNPHIDLLGVSGFHKEKYFGKVMQQNDPLMSEKVTQPTPAVGQSAGPNTPEYTGGSVSYYQVVIKKPTTEGRPEYIAECNDIIEALGMNFAEGNALKALWRRAAERTLGLTKGNSKGDGLYDAEKVVFFGQRLVEQSKGGA